MASSREYLEHILDGLPAGNVRSRPMMGEFILYYRGVIVGGIYDDRLLVKPTPAAAAYLSGARLETPYEGGKPMLLVENVDSREFLTGLFESMTGNTAR